MARVDSGFYVALWDRLSQVVVPGITGMFNRPVTLRLVYGNTLANGMRGYFAVYNRAPDGTFAFHAPSPRIMIHRAFRYSDGPDPSRASVEEVCTLAHEYGHFLSWLGWFTRQTGPWRAYFDAACKRDAIMQAQRTGRSSPLRFTHEDRRLILDEEQRATRHGARLLESVGFRHWPAWARGMGRNVRNHREIYASFRREGFC